MRRAWILASLLLIGCPNEPEPEVPPTPGEGPVVAYVEPELVETDWWIGLLDNTSNDVIAEDIEDGGLNRPSSGTDEDGTFWLEADQDESGSVQQKKARFDL